MQANYVQRLRLEFSKTGPTRFIGHLDLARTLERSLNRAHIPMAYTQGFNRRPRMQMATALPLGYTSQCELADILLLERLDPEATRQQMMAKMAPGITIHHITEVPINAASLQNQTVESTYVATLLDAVDAEILQQQINEMMSQESIIRERNRGKKRKVYDLRPLILDIQQTSNNDGLTQLTMRLTLMPAKTGRPDEVLLQLGLDPLAARIHRTQLILQEK